MFANMQAKAVYGQTNQALLSTEETEYKIFAQITSDLAKASQPGVAFAQLAEALHRNQRLWTILAGDISSTDNALPEKLRAELFYLFEFTVHHTDLVLNGQATTEPLIDVNRSVMRGLSKREAA